MRKIASKRTALVLSAAATLSTAAALSPAAASTLRSTPVPPKGFTVTTFATSPDKATVGPDDIATLNGHVFVGWQNGVGPKGEPNPKTGQRSGTVVEYNTLGQAVRRYDLMGKIDGIAGNPASHELIATVNEDGKSSLYTITPTAAAGHQVAHYTYSPKPDAAATGGVYTGGGTDAVTVHNGGIYLTASNPTPKNATAAFRVVLDPKTGIARLGATFADNATARDAVTGAQVMLGLTDPDSSASVPASSPRFGGDFVVSAQADQQLVFAAGLGTGTPALTRLRLTRVRQSAGTDDVRWTDSAAGKLYIVDNKANAVYRVTGPFSAGQPFASLDTVGAKALTSEVDRINLKTGALTQFVTGLGKAKGLLWVPAGG